MKVFKGTSGLDQSWQNDFPKEMHCQSCGDEGARIALVAYENSDDRGHAICDLHKNDPGEEGFWPHDFIAVAVYFCRNLSCEPSVQYNQA